jgi:hypothetical protein
MKNNHVLKNQRRIKDINADDIEKDKKSKKRKNEKFSKILDNFKDTDTDNVKIKNLNNS